MFDLFTAFVVIFEEEETKETVQKTEKDRCRRKQRHTDRYTKHIVRKEGGGKEKGKKSPVI